MSRAITTGLLVTLTVVLALTGCPTGGESNRPDIPVPDSYIAEVPSVSDELIIATVPLTAFAPNVTTARDEEGNDLPGSPGLFRVDLVVNGNPAPNPTFNGQPAEPLTNTPHLQFVRYWKRLGAPERYSGATTTTVSRSFTQGTTNTEASSFAYTVGVSTTVSVDAGIASASATVSAEFGSETSTEIEVSESVTDTQTYEVAVEQAENLVFCVWQLVDEFRIVMPDGDGWVPFADPAYVFEDASLAPLVVPRDELRNISYQFDNPVRN